MARNKKKKNPVVVFFKVIFILAIILLAGFLFGFSFYQYNVLSNEVTQITSITPGEDEINMDLATMGEYQQVEVLIKNYMQEYLEELDKLRNVLAEEQFENILSVENMEKDGPEFTESYAYLEQKEQEIDSLCDTLLAMREEENYLAPGKAADLNFFLQWEYDTNMETIARSYMYDEESLEKTKTELKDYIDHRREALDFLKDNKDSWHIEDGKISFVSEDLLRHYNELIS